MGTISTTVSNLPLIMNQFDLATRRNGGFVFRSSPANDGTGVLTVPDALMSQVQAAMTSNAMVAQEIVILKAYLANIRYGKETGGITISNVPVATDRTSQSMIANAVALLNADSSLTSINFKQADGSWSTIARADMVSMAVTIGTYVQACFNNEYAISQQIDAGTIAQTSQLDAATGWPNTSF